MMERRSSLILPAVIALCAATAADAQNSSRSAPAQEINRETAQPLRAVERAGAERVRASLQEERRRIDRNPGFAALIQPPGQRTPDTPPQPDAPRLYPIDWTQVAVDAREQQAALAANQTFTALPSQSPPFPAPRNPDRAAQVADARLPILLPPVQLLDMGEDPDFFLFPAENHYTASFIAEDFLVEIFGTRTAHAEPPTALAARRLRVRDGEGFQLTRTRYGQELNFNRYGAAYSITIECDDPETDPHCFNEDYARLLARNLRYAAGSEGED